MFHLLSQVVLSGLLGGIITIVERLLFLWGNPAYAASSIFQDDLRFFTLAVHPGASIHRMTDHSTQIGEDMWNVNKQVQRTHSQMYTLYGHINLHNKPKPLKGHYQQNLDISKNEELLDPNGNYSSQRFSHGMSFILVRTIEDTSSGAITLSSPFTWVKPPVYQQKPVRHSPNTRINWNIICIIC